MIRASPSASRIRPSPSRRRSPLTSRHHQRLRAGRGRRPGSSRPGRGSAPTTCRKSRRASAASWRDRRSGRKKKTPATTRTDNQSGIAGEMPEPSSDQPAEQQRERAARPTASSTLVARNPSNDRPSSARSAAAEWTPSPGGVEACQPHGRAAAGTALTLPVGQDEPHARRAVPSRPASIAPAARRRPGRGAPGTARGPAGRGRARAARRRAGSQSCGVPRRPEARPCRNRPGLSKLASRRSQTNAAAEERRPRRAARPGRPASSYGST